MRVAASAASVVLAVAAAACSSSATPRAPSTSQTSTPQAAAGVRVRPSPGCGGTGPGSPPPVAGANTIAVGGVARAYRLAVPPAASGDRPSPLVFVFHGFAGSGASIATLTGMLDKGAANGDFVVAPDGTNNTWQINAHGTDATFIDALIDHITSSSCIDLDRIFATGFSAGAAFTTLFSCARQSRIAAIATVAVDFQLGCTTPTPIVAFHGTKDGSVPYEDGAAGLSLPGVKVRGTELNMGDWAKLDGCAPTPRSEVIGTEVTKEVWRSCAAGSDVVLYRVEGGGHTWPGADPAAGIGLTTQQVNATEQILAFFADHPRRS